VSRTSEHRPDAPRQRGGSSSPVRREPRPGPQSVALAVAGDLDTGGADRLRAQLDDATAPARRLVLDLSQVEHLSSAALAVLVAAHRRLRDGGGALVVRDPSPAVVRVLRVSGLHRVILVDPPESLPD
jgi:anti-anti-sigma factor